MLLPGAPRVIFRNGSGAPAPAPATVRTTSLVMPGYQLPAAPAPARAAPLGPTSPGFFTPPSYSNPNPPQFVPPSPVSGQMGRPAEWLQYDIRNPAFAQLLREAFDTSGGSGWALASEIVPVYVVNQPGSGAAGGDAIPWRTGFVVAGAAAGTLAHFSVNNDLSDRLITIDRIVGITGGGVFRAGVLAADIPLDVDDIRTIQPIDSADLRGARSGVVVEVGRIDDNAASVAIKDALPLAFQHVANLMQERWEGAILAPGQAYYCLGNGIIGGDSFIHVWLEGTEVPI